MPYTVLARKYRSRTFAEVIGQEPIATTLVNAIKVGRIHHGYLFTGTRGVGKTSMARILAKALNCQKYDAPTTTPCGECDVCRAIAEGQDVDVLEIDAASNTGVDNIRELRSNTAYRPARARYKVYIIDEVHMLSTGAFNALLKTLEEPPDHVKFILATTEIQKVPATIQSRCQRFNFRHIEPEAIARRLLDIARAEGAACEEAVAQRVARLAAGSMRDALSILDQLLSVSPQKIDMQVLDEVLPPPQHERLRTLLSRAADGDVAAVLTEADGILAAGHGLEVFCQEAIELLRTLLLVRVCGPDAAMVDIPAGARDDYVKLSRRFEVSHYVQMIPMLEELRRNVRYSGAGRALTEALLVRFAHMRQWASIEELLGQLPADATGADEKKKTPPPAPRVSAPDHTPLASTEGYGPATGGAPGRDPTPLPSRSPRTTRGGEEGLGEGRSSPNQRSFPAASPATPASARPALSAGRAEARGPAARAPAMPDDLPVGDLEPNNVPSDYRPIDAEPPPPGEVVRRELTLEERRRIEDDPVVRQTLALFDGILIDVQRTAAAAPGRAE
ncbi:MAG: DNA polymerase III subunit gamma/tau [Planctomycetota bacterium]